MSLMFPEGIEFEPKDDQDWNRMGIMMKIIDKTIRYNAQFLVGGLEDSLKDIIAYAAMLLEIDSEEADEDIS